MTLDGQAERGWVVTYRLEPEDLRETHRRTVRHARYRRVVVVVAAFFVLLGAGMGSLIGFVTRRSLPVAIAIGAGVGMLMHSGFGSNDLALVVPLKAFESESHADQFLRMASRWHSRAAPTGGDSP